MRRCAARILGDDEEARDIAQVAFIRAWENLAKYDPAWSFSTWLYRIATNLAIDVLRSRDSRDRTHQTHLRLVGDSEAPTAPREVAEGEVQRIFGELAERLTPAQRAAFVLREVEGLSTAEVAQSMGCTEATVRNHVFQASAVLRRELTVALPGVPAAGRWTMSALPSNPDGLTPSSAWSWSRPGRTRCGTT